MVDYNQPYNTIVGGNDNSGKTSFRREALKILQKSPPPSPYKGE